MPEQLTPQQRKAMISQLGSDSKAKLDEANFVLQMKGMKIQEQEIQLRSQIIACEAAEGYLRMLDIADAMAAHKLSFAGRYRDYAIAMLEKTAPDVEALKRYMNEEEVRQAAERLEKKGIITHQ